ncbi:hypothetical protein ABUW04_09350 [Streptacidiphilus sp. N1-10]|uniref:PH domain-containing protein n=1 Tax=Streptacidiphilus jeojiensis TaxID=3229225 RepID=A0ABV6XJN3_9ACTN
MDTAVAVAVYGGFPGGLALFAALYGSAHTVLNDKGIRSVFIRRRRIAWSQVERISVRSTANYGGKLRRVQIFRKGGRRCFTMWTPQDLVGNNPEFDAQAEQIKWYWTMAQGQAPSAFLPGSQQ